MNLFENARLKVTSWYVATIMLISILFSSAIYTVVSFEINRSFTRVEHRITAGEMGFTITGDAPADFTMEARDLASKRVRDRLITANFIIFFFATAAGYLLSGLTLAPIEDVHEQQKRFIADASHELKTPLTALRTSIEVSLRDKKLNLNVARETLENSLEDLDSLENLTHNLLSLSSIQDNGITFIPIDLDDSVRQVAKNLKPLVTRRKIKLKLNLQPIIIDADESKLIELITILLDNAIKYNKSNGSITISMVQQRSKANITISDTGIGITRKDLPLIFDRFYRADLSRSPQNVPGSGLGLSLAKQIIDYHNGSIKVTSTENKGSVFTVTLPLKQG